MSIQAIDTSSIHSLTSGQVVIDLQTAVKELVENALDAGATSIDVKFKEHGYDSIEVQDNGKGIDQEDWPGIALKHHTSKLTSFADLASVSTLGFRGEALSSLCGTATVSLVTSTASSAPIGTSLTFKQNGECIVGGKVARAKGTTIKVENLFNSLPVRRKELQKNAKREFGKALELLQAYALVSTGVRFEVKNTTKSKTMTHLQSPASPSLRSNFSSIFAPKSLQAMMDLELSLKVAADKNVLRWTEGPASTTEVKVRGLISKPSAGNGRTSGNRQFYFINGRPFHPTKIAKAINEVYKSFVPGSFPTVVADFQLATDAYDVNVSPDKRTIFLHSEGNLIAALKTALEEFYQPSQSTFEMTNIGSKTQSSSKAVAKVKEKEASSESGETLQDQEEEEAERPRKRKKMNDAEETGESEGEGSSDERVPANTTPATNGNIDASMDMEIDAGMFASTQDHTFPFDFGGAANFDDPEQSFELPIPPSPIRRAAELARSSIASSPPRARNGSTSGSTSPLRSPIQPNLEVNPVASTSRTSQEPFSPFSKSQNDKPLFRSSPSPTPAPAERHSPPPRARSPSRSPTPPSHRSPAAVKLRQPQLSFASAASDKTVEKKKDRKGKGKEKAKAMKDLLDSFIRPGGSVASQQDPRIVNASEEEDEDDEEIGSPQHNGGGEDEAELNGSEDGSIENGLKEETSEKHKSVDVKGREKEEKTIQPEEEEEDDELEIVEESFQTAGPSQTNLDDEEEDELEIISASCACVHGSPLDKQQEEDPQKDSNEAEPEQPQQVEAPFGGAPAEIAGIFIAADTTLESDFSSIESVWSSKSSTEVALSRHCEGSPALSATEDHDELVGAGLEQTDVAAEATLSRVVSKDDFEAMEVIGQFNLGFIIARRRVNPTGTGQSTSQDLHDDLFIIDQHASDEKYNFEKLQAETVIQSQRLLAPRVLNLPSHDEITAIEHLDLLRLNGYDVVVDEDADVGERVKLLAQPVSNKTVFDIADFEELLDLIGSRAGNEIVRPSKTRKMFASRACRKSVMIGKALNSNQMTSIIRHMGGMDQPWACPHGRPTMRWLAGLGKVSDPDSRSNLGSILEAYDREVAAA
ncbi:hypothetical protein JCM3765_003999 [Sporobolomyces pararoseus]